MQLSCFIVCNSSQREVEHKALYFISAREVMSPNSLQWDEEVSGHGLEAAPHKLPILCHS